MAGNVLSWEQALRMGYQPRLYGYQPGLVPTGMFNAVLDFKIWAKQVIGINCFFRLPDTDQKFQVTVYLSGRSKAYKTGGSATDFHSCPIDTVYRLHTRLNAAGKVVLMDAFLE